VSLSPTEAAGICDTGVLSGGNSKGAQDEIEVSEGTVDLRRVTSLPTRGTTAAADVQSCLCEDGSTLVEWERLG